MSLQDDDVVYAITVENIRRVVEEEGRGPLTDEEIKRLEDRIGEYIPWYDAIVMTLQDCFPESHSNKQNED
jgi:hypothetical protein